MTDGEYLCRICRGEATRNQPLIHPCKCRGSIRYIHENCLMEWLKHSNKSTKKCDICNTPYKFTTIYDPNMPKSMPIRFVIDKILSLLRTWVTRNVLILLFVTAFVQICTFWKVVGRLLTFAVDGKLPSPDFDAFLSLIYGTTAVLHRKEDLSPETPFRIKFYLFSEYTLLLGFLHVLMFVIMVAALFVEHEWVVRDEGYIKLFLNKVGREPRRNFLDLLNEYKRRHGNNHENPVAWENAMEDIRNAPDNVDPSEVLRQAIDATEFDPLLRRGNAQAPPRNADVGHPNEFHNINPANINHFPGGPPPPNYENADALFDNEASDREVYEEEPSELDGDAPEELERRRQIINDELAAAENPMNGDFFDLLGIKLNISTPILLTLMADFVIMFFLFNAYLVPHIIGNLVITTAVLISKIFLKGFSYFLPNFKNLAWINAGMTNLKQLVEQHPETLKPMKTAVFDPCYKLLIDVFTLDKIAPPSATERVIVLGIGYMAIWNVIYRIMQSMVSGEKPILGTSRRIYKALFEFATTAKVFIVFAVEIVLFPAYCGWLIDICLTPLLVKDIFRQGPNAVPTFVLLSTAVSDTASVPTMRVILYWAFGTAYMLFFALFVGMVRNKILRPGVLFFIRSPDDPNARLIHDALVKSLRFQLLRIWLSAKFYTGNILLGIGVVTWGLRWLTASPDPSKHVFLPIQFSYEGAFLLSLLTAMIIHFKDVLAKIVKSFWDRLFTVICFKLRLSHFILGRPIVQERGRIVYRSFLYQLLGIGEPDYLKPVTYTEALDIFRTDTSVIACFVPDGYYVRAPSSDTSRRFLHNLFIPVSKLDQPLQPVENKQEPPRNEEYDSDYSDDELMYENSYEVVYRPPQFKQRNFALIILLGLFAQVLFVSVGITAVLIGRPFIMTGEAIKRFILAAPSQFDSARLDDVSIILGLLIVTAGLIGYFDGPRLRAANFIANNNEILRPGFDLISRQSGIFLGKVFIFACNQVVRFVIHLCVASFEKYLFGFSLYEKGFNIKTGWRNVLLQLSVVPLSFWLQSFDMSEGESFVHALWRCGGFESILSIAFLIGLRISSGFIPESTGANIEPMVAAKVMAVIVIPKALFGGLRTIRVVNEQIKNERYVKGTAVENIDVEGEDFN